MSVQFSLFAWFCTRLKKNCTLKAHCTTYPQLEIRSVEPGICPIATLYSLTASYKGGRCKQGAIIFHGGRVIVIFVLKFVAMATGVGKGKISMTLSYSLGPKIGGRCKQRAIIFYGDRVIPL